MGLAPRARAASDPRVLATTPDEAADEDEDAADERFGEHLLRRAMNIKVTNAMLNRITANSALPRPLRLRGFSDDTGLTVAVAP
mmetsp:Transcript_23778/g.94284  ORF Transcript_23778/g.94284 Transcript_23778/m.94284 type:complete len:84 (+) Transcript_23778:1302-1553(+)